MPREIVKLVYDLREMIEGEYDDFSERAVDKARQWVIEAVTEFDWWDYVIDMWKQMLNEIGFENAEIEFNGFSCQGDGASFTADIDLEKLTAFLAHHIAPSSVVSTLDDPDSPLGTPGEEYFAPYVVHLIGGKPAPNPKYTRLQWLVNVHGLSVKRTNHHYCHANTCCIEDIGRTCWLDDGNYRRCNQLWKSFLSDAEEVRLDLCRAIYSMLEDDYYVLIEDENLVETAEVNGWTFDQHGERDGHWTLDELSQPAETVEAPIIRKRKLLLGSSIHRVGRGNGGK